LYCLGTSMVAWSTLALEAAKLAAMSYIMLQEHTVLHASTNYL
jgi:hypothetical protein